MGEKIDILNRGEFIEQLIQLVAILADNRQACCFGIDGEWGSGKTFVLEKLEKQLKDLQSEDTFDNKYYVFHYDCWKYDYYDEPAIAIIAAMLDATDQELSLFPKDVENAGKIAMETVKGTLMKIASELCKNKIGIDLVEIASDVLEKHDEEKIQKFDLLYGFKKALEETRKGIEEIAKNKTIVIVVDELDRCLPTYSIKVLERLHHIFNELDNVIVIVSMDKKQLTHSIEEIYGKIDVDTYLRKFISFKVSLDNGKVARYSEKFEVYFSMFDIPMENLEIIEKFLSDVLIGLDMRTQERIFNKAKVIHTMINDDKIVEDSIMIFEILYLTVSLKLKDKNLQWLSEIGEEIYTSKERILGEEYYDMLNQYWLDACGVNLYGERFVLNSTLLGRMFMWLSVLYKDKYDEELILYKEEVEMVKKFAKLIEIVDVD